MSLNNFVRPVSANANSVCGSASSAFPNRNCISVGSVVTIPGVKLRAASIVRWKRIAFDLVTSQYRKTENILPILSRCSPFPNHLESFSLISVSRIWFVTEITDCQWGFEVGLTVPFTTRMSAIHWWWVSASGKGGCM